MAATREDIVNFIDDYLDLCDKYGLILLGKFDDNFLCPADIETMRGIATKDGQQPEMEIWLDKYYDDLSSEEVIDYCYSRIEEYNND